MKLYEIHLLISTTNALCNRIFSLVFYVSTQKKTTTMQDTIKLRPKCNLKLTTLKMCKFEGVIAVAFCNMKE